MEKINIYQLKLHLNQLRLSLVLALLTVSSEVYAIAPLVELFQKGSAALQTIGGAAVIFSLAFLLLGRYKKTHNYIRTNSRVQRYEV